MKIIKVPVADLVPYEGNAKLHPQEQIEQIKKSIQELGFNDPIAIDQDNVIIEGHGRWLAVQELGWETVECIRLDHLTDEQRRAYTLIHNKLTMNSGFDLAVLELELQRIQDIDMGAFDLSLDDIHLEDNEVEEPDAFEVDVPEVNKKPARVKPGQLWSLGEHRLYIGDSTKLPDVYTLMGETEADLLLTDPPYNINYEGTAGTILNDNMLDGEFREFLRQVFANARDVMRPGAAYYVWHADNESYNFRGALLDVGFQIRQCLIWRKHTFTLGRQDYQWIHEPCLYGWKDGAAHYFINDRKQHTFFESPDLLDFHKMSKAELVALLDDMYSELIPTTVIDENKPMKSELHPTMKPIKLMARQIVNSTKPGQIVLDLFGGSGSTLIACEQLGRICHTMELDPSYADVIIRRWEEMTGKTAELLKG